MRALIAGDSLARNVVSNATRTAEDPVRGWVARVVAALPSWRFENVAFGGTGFDHWAPGADLFESKLRPRMEGTTPPEVLIFSCGVNDLTGVGSRSFVPAWVVASGMREWVRATEHWEVRTLLCLPPAADFVHPNAPAGATKFFRVAVARYRRMLRRLDGEGFCINGYDGSRLDPVADFATGGRPAAERQDPHPSASGHRKLADQTEAILRRVEADGR